MEQDFKLRKISDALDNPNAKKEDIKTVFLALQKQNFILANSLTNLIEKWPKPPPRITDLDITGVAPSSHGVLFVIKNSTSTSET
tara:strand:- start:1310 stop:1564 length:255 start_codon:yes stop_codon:yes gene_type:complete